MVRPRKSATRVSPVIATAAAGKTATSSRQEAGSQVRGNGEKKHKGASQQRKGAAQPTRSATRAAAPSIAGFTPQQVIVIVSLVGFAVIVGLAMGGGFPG